MADLMKDKTKLVISIVSHNQMNMVYDLLKDIAKLKIKIDTSIVLTINVKEEIRIPKNLSCKLFIIENLRPLGFGANHNQAFKYIKSDFFLILNPDLRMADTCIDNLIDSFSNPKIGCVAPLILNSKDQVEDSFRKFPTIFSILKRLFRNELLVKPIKKLEVDWVAGMFMLFNSNVFNGINGFNSNRYFMYVEDIDICFRIKKLGYKTILIPKEKAVHDAQRESRRSFRAFFHHATGLIKFFILPK